MTEDEYNAFNAFSEELDVDENNLDAALIRAPRLQFEVSTYVAESRMIRDSAKHAYEAISAAVGIDIRGQYTEQGAKAPAIDFIKSEALLVQDVIDAQNALMEADRDLAYWNGLADAIKTKGYSINTISELMKAGYMTPETIYQNQQDQIRQARANTRGGG